MKRSIILILFLQLVIGCENKKTNTSIKTTNSVELIPTYTSLHFNSELKAAIDSFIHQSNCKTCFYEMYVNKVYPDSFLLTLEAKGYPSFNNNNPLFTSVIEGKTIYIYSGLEDVFRGDMKLDSNIIDSTNKEYHIWTISVKKQGISIDTFGYYPFFPVSPPKIQLRKVQ